MPMPNIKTTISIEKPIFDRVNISQIFTVNKSNLSEKIGIL